MAEPLCKREQITNIWSSLHRRMIDLASDIDLDSNARWPRRDSDLVGVSRGNSLLELRLQISLGGRI
jgi:hypothetical protein